MQATGKETDYDWVIVGSGFGGSVSALRLTEKGYRVLVVEKGRRFSEEEFPDNNWDLKRWLWKPAMGLKGIFQMSFLDHVTVLHGVGVGGGSLVYANTLPTPKDNFFSASSWGHLANWRDELAPHYRTAKRMLGATTNPVETEADKVLREIARDIGREEHFHPTEVAVYFGPPGTEVDDPYFEGRGPRRTGCTFCGACMTGCKVGAKNTLDKNYLYLAEKDGCEIAAETEVVNVHPKKGSYTVDTEKTFGGEKRSITCSNVVFAGGVMGTVPLLLKLRDETRTMPSVSPKLGKMVRTNSESLLAIAMPETEKNFSKGVAITSILHTDEHSHIEPCRYGEGSGFFRTLMVPHAPFPNLAGRLAGTALGFLKHPLQWAKVYSMREFAKRSQVLLYMRTLEGSLSIKLGRSVMTGFRKGIVTELDDNTEAPKAFMEEATDLAKRFAEKVKGSTVSLLTETLLGTPSTAHILGGCNMGSAPEEGVINYKHELFGYPGMYVIDGSAISANPGVNPSLTITALAERAMSFIPPKGRSDEPAP